MTETPTLGEIAVILEGLKDLGVHRGSVLFVVDKVWWEKSQHEEAGR